MDFKISRIIILIAVLLSACSPTLPPQPEPWVPSATPGFSLLIPEPRFTPGVVRATKEAPPLTGRVVDVDGNPLSGARIDSDSNSVLSAANGSFSLPGVGTPQWVRASLEGFISRTRAVGPNQPTIFRLSPDDGHTVVLQFAGDVMFGRRFFDPNEDGDPSDGFLPVQPDLNDHSRLLASIQPLINNADLTTVNLESTLSDHPYLSPRESRPAAYHSTQAYVYSTHPSAIQALKQAGIDVVDLGNNHVYDLLEDGLANTISVLKKNDLAYFGAGRDEAGAWKPTIVTVGGQEVAFVGCTTIWRPGAVKENPLTFVAQDQVPKGGSAWCAEGKLYHTVSELRKRDSLVVVMIHGGFEYDRTPGYNILKFSKLARQAGATLVINHHTHVVGGLSWDEPVLTAWSLGNFIFDQTVWSTLQSYILTVYVRDNKVVRAFTEPLIIHEYLPHGLTGSMAEFVARNAAGQNPGPFVIEAGAVEVDLAGQTKSKTTVQVMNGDAVTGKVIPIPAGQWVSAFQGSGNLRLGRDLLWVGSFEPEMVQTKPTGPLLWPLTESQLYGPEFAYQGRGGLSLMRGQQNQADSVTTHLRRIAVIENSELTITGMARPSPGALASLQVSWYPKMVGPSSQRLDQILAVEANGDWQPFQVDLKVPPGIVAASVLIRLSPPVSGVASLDLDDLRLIEWADPKASFSPLYTHILLKGEGEVSFRQDYLPLAP